MKKIDVSQIKYTSPDSAYNAGELWYKKKLTNPETGDEFYQARPIFIVDKSDKFDVSVPLLYKFFQKSEICIMLRNGSLGSEIRYIYENGVYKIANDSDIMRILSGYIEDFNVRFLNPYILRQALELNDCTCPCHKHDVMNNNEDLINFQNGLLNIKSLELTEHTPDVMSSIQIPCNWTEKEIPTPEFDRFLNTLTKGDHKSQKLILEYMGAVLSNVQGWRFKKAMFLHGKGNTGKSTIINLLCKLLGSENISERDLKGLNERFGKTAAYNKRLIYSNDLAFMNIEENAIFKNLTGGDSISIEYKNREPFDFKFKGLLLYGMNELPKFGGDKGEHVYNRIIIVSCDNVIADNKIDPELENKIYAERDGIVRKCILALKKAVERGYKFSITNECVDNLREYKRENSLPVEFFTSYVEKVEIENPVLGANVLYNNFRTWCTEQGIVRISTFPEFRKEISSFLSEPWSNLTKRKSDGMYLKDYKMREIWQQEHHESPK